MNNEPRKATDVLLAIETQVNVLLSIIRAQDLNIKVLSNKLSEAISLLNKQVSQPKITVEAVQTMPSTGRTIPAGDPERNIPITAESRLPQTDTPQGFRRTSRPETYAGDDNYLPRAEKEKQPEPEVIVPAKATQKKPAQKQPTAPMTNQTPAVVSPPTQGQIPVMQRCVDKNGKSIFLADVEIVDLASGEKVFKTKTNGTGKWMAALSLGVYRVSVKKRESLTKEKLEAMQDITVDGSSSPLELNMVIIK